MTAGAGINFARQDASSTSFPFVDVARSMRRWLANNYTEYAPGILPANANGWPTSIPKDDTDGNYLVNGALSAEATTIAVDSGTGAIEAGDIVMFAGHTTQYVVQTDLAGGSFTIASGLTHAVANNAAVTLLSGVQTLMCRENDAAHPAGTYRVLVEGTGTLQFGFDAAAKTVQVSGVGEDTIEVTPTTTGGILMQITALDAQDPIDRIRVLLPGFAPTTKYHPTFLSQVRRFGCGRTMDLAKTNGDSDVVGSTIVQWAERAPANWYTVDHQHGMPWEEIIDLHNAAGLDLWVNIPHQAHDDYVTALAQLVLQRLSSERRVKVEFSNEYWNSHFRQHTWAAAFADSRGITGQTWTRSWLGGAERALEVHAKWMEVWTGANADRVTRVLAIQSANTGQGSMVDLQLNHRHTLNNARVGDNVDALAGAPYFGSDLGGAQNGPTTATWTEAQVINYCRTEITTTVAQRMAGMQAHATEWSLECITYEVGHHLAATEGQWSNATLVALFLAVNRNVAMLELYKLYLRTWFLNTEGGMLCWFNFCSVPTQYGAWGHLERQDQDVATAYKWRIIGALEGRFRTAYGTSSVRSSTGRVGAASGVSLPITGTSRVPATRGTVGTGRGICRPITGTSDVSGTQGSLGDTTGVCVPARGRSSIKPCYAAATQLIYPPAGPQVGISISVTGTSDVSGTRGELGSLPGICGPIRGRSSVGGTIGEALAAVVEFADLVRSDAHTLIDLEGEEIIYYEGGTGPGTPMKAYIDRRGYDSGADELAELRGPDIMLLVLVGIGGIAAHGPQDEAEIPIEEGGPLTRVRVPRRDRKTGGLWHLEVQR